MLDRVPLPQLSAAKPRVGLQRIDQLVRCLVRQYELHARIREAACPASGKREAAREAVASGPPAGQAHTLNQRQFDWYSAQA